MEFVDFPKIPRWSRDIVITEKIDGTNGQIAIERYTEPFTETVRPLGDPLVTVDEYAVWAGSRNRWLKATKGQDNHGFAAFVHDNADALVQILGEGRHFGEWWGNGIQRGYGLPNGDKRFSLFNVSKWKGLPIAGGIVNKVPILYEGPWYVPCSDPAVVITTIMQPAVENTLTQLGRHGSTAVPGYMNPEGIVIFHTAKGYLFKKTFSGDESGKGQE